MIPSTRRMLLLAFLLVGFTAAAPAQRVTTNATMAGEWDGTLALEGGSHHLSFVFRLADSTLTGYVNDNGSTFGNMESLSLSGDTIRFTVQGLEFTGVVSGTTMNIDAVMFNGNHRQMTAAKVQEKAKPERDDIPGD